MTDLTDLTLTTLDATTLKKGGSEITPSASELNLLDGASQAAVQAALTIIYTGNDPSITPDASITFADGSTPTVGELLEAVEELAAITAALLACVKGAGLMATS